jgi:Zn-dependent M28 family amino/carboxypeptidase
MADDGTVSGDVEQTPGHTWNVLGRIPGESHAHEVILLSAHLDHIGAHGTGPDTIFNGADDDASGVTAVLEFARVLAGRHLDRTIIVALFGSEEAGGFGARHFLEHPPVPLETIVANLEFEMIGRPDPAVPPNTLWLTGYERSTLGPELARRGARIVADPHRDQNFFARSDNIALARRGVVAQTISSYGLHREYHTPADDLAHIDFTHMTAAIASMVAPIEWLADSSFKPEWRPGMMPEPRRGATP